MTTTADILAALRHYHDKAALKRPTLDQLIERARAELATNPSITVYTFENGVEHRRPANPFAGLNTAASRLSAAFASLGEAARAAASSVAQMFEARLAADQFANVYGRILPIDRQESAATSGCVDCGHAHWDEHQHLYVRCAMCRCGNVGRNSVPVSADTTDVTPWADGRDR